MAKAKPPLRIIGIKVVQIVKSGTTTQPTSLQGSEYLCCFLLSGVRKALTETKLSKQFNICSQPRHEVTLPAQLLFLLCTGHNYDIFPPDDVCQSKSGRPRRWLSTTAGSECVWSSHLSNQLTPAGRSCWTSLQRTLGLFSKEAQTLIPSAQFETRGLCCWESLCRATTNSNIKLHTHRYAEHRYTEYTFCLAE